jgi:transcriptional regulator with XRE-family HTH domain
MANGTELSSNTSKRKNLVNELKDPIYRRAFIEAHAKDTIAFQLRQMRETRGWTQGELAVKAFDDPKLQSMVSRLENPDYGKYSVTTLLNLANVFDVGLVVRFAPFSEVVDWDLNKSGPTLDPPPFAQDIGLEETPVSICATPSQVVKAEQPTTMLLIEVGSSSVFYRHADSRFITGRKPWLRRSQTLPKTLLTFRMGKSL